MKGSPQQIDHAQPVKLGGAAQSLPSSPSRPPPRRSAALTVLEHAADRGDVATFAFVVRSYDGELVLEQVPNIAARDVVITTAPPPPLNVCRPAKRPCGFVTCPQHLWFIEANDRQGRRHDGKPPPPLIKPSSRSTCALDLATRENSAEQIGGVLGIGARRVQQIVDEALAKLRAAGENVEVLLGA